MSRQHTAPKEDKGAFSIFRLGETGETGIPSPPPPSYAKGEKQATASRLCASTVRRMVVVDLGRRREGEIRDAPFFLLEVSLRRRYGRRYSA